MITANDAVFSTYNAKIGDYDAEIFADGDIFIEGANGSRISVTVAQLAALLATSVEFIEEHRKVKNGK